MKDKVLFLLLSSLLLIGCSLHNNEEDFKLQNEASPVPTEMLLATFTTPILTTDPDRYHNITLVRDKLNGFILEKNAEFSFNTVCGPFGKEEGFKEASILLSNGEHDEGYGGGVCQLSSTLYNAIKDLNVNITERHHHSAPVGYVPENDDATISMSSGLDFRFINETGYDLKFQVESTEKQLTVSVYQIKNGCVKFTHPSFYGLQKTQG